MIEGLRPYPDMQSTGEPWLPSIPAHWEVRRNGRLFSERRETGYPDLPILEVSLRSGVRIRDMDDGKRKQQIADRSVYQRAVKGDIAYNMMRMWQGAVGIAPADGLVSPAYVVATAHDGVDPAYYAYLFRTDDYMKEIDSFSRGIVPDRNRLYWQAFKQMPSAYPSPDEQKLIVRFLDWHGAMTGKLIRTKRRLIALLNEQKQSIIHRAVTRGLDPAAKLKSSGVDWLGDMPEHWEMLPFHACYAEKAVPNIGMLESTVLSLSYGRIVIKPREKLFGLVPASFETYQIVDPGDIIIRCTDLQNDKKSLRTGLSAHRGIITSAYLSLRPKNNLSCEFAHLILATYDALKIIYGYGSGLRQNLSFKDLKHMPIPVPPRAEQPQIISEIQRQTAEIEQAIQQCTKELALVAELRTRLIADVVTGQLDVRAVAPGLPDVAETDAASDLTDEDELDDDAGSLIDEEEAA